MAGSARDYCTPGRIVARLLALAALAERAGGFSFPVRFVVLAIIGVAERATHAWLHRATGGFWAFPEMPADLRGRLGDADFLALRLRVLAAALGAWLQLEDLAACCRIGGVLPGAADPLLPSDRKRRHDGRVRTGTGCLESGP